MKTKNGRKNVGDNSAFLELCTKITYKKKNFPLSRLFPTYQQEEALKFSEKNIMIICRSDAMTLRSSKGVK